MVNSPQHTGLDAGRFLPFGNGADLPPDQRDEDAKSACFEFEAPSEVRVLGRPARRLVHARHPGRPEPLRPQRQGPRGRVAARRHIRLAVASATGRSRLHRPELAWDVTVETHSEITC